MTKKNWIHKKYSDAEQSEQEWAARYNCPYCKAEKPILTFDGKTDKTLKAKESKHKCRQCNAEWQWYTHNTTGDRVKTTRLDIPDQSYDDPFTGVEVHPNLTLLALIEDTLADLVTTRELSLKYSPYSSKTILRRLITLGWAESYDIVEGTTVYPMARASAMGRSVYNNRSQVPLRTLIVML